MEQNRRRILRRLAPIAVIGPDTSAMGERANAAKVTQAEIASTIAEFLGKDFRKASPDHASPLAVLSQPLANTR